MLRKFGSHLRDQWMGALALFLVLSGGTAYAANTVLTGDIKDNEVYSTDVSNDTLPWGGLTSVDLRPGSVRSAEVADKTLTGEDLANQFTVGDVVGTGEDLGWVDIEGAENSPITQGRVTAFAYTNGAYEQVSIAPSHSALNQLRAYGALELKHDTNDPLGEGLTDPGLLFNRATNTPPISGEQAFVYTRRNSGVMQLVIFWPSGERDILATYNTEP